MTETTHPLETSIDARRDERRAITVAGGAHLLHDGYTDLIYIMLPVWQPEFGLSYAEVGVLRALYAGTMAAFQIPIDPARGAAGRQRRAGRRHGAGGVGYMLAGISPGLGPARGRAVPGRARSSTQHPLASSLVAHAFAGPRSLKGAGTYNFTGDLGKMTVPLTASLLMMALPWRPTIAIIGGFRDRGRACNPGTDAALRPGELSRARGGCGRARGRAAPEIRLSAAVLDRPHRQRDPHGVPHLSAVPADAERCRHSDHRHRPDAGVPGGAVGKLACAFIGARIGVIATVFLTEGLTTALILALLPLPLDLGLILLPLLGIGLNGTSSVLYGSVPVLVTPERRARAFGIFYTGVIGSGAAAPVAIRRRRRRARRGDDTGGDRAPAAADAAARARAAAVVRALGSRGWRSGNSRGRLLCEGVAAFGGGEDCSLRFSP